MNIHETIIVIHIYLSTHKYTHLDTCTYDTVTHVHMTRDIYIQTNKIAHTNRTNLPILLHLHVCLGIYAHA